MCATVSLNGGQNVMKKNVKRIEQSRKRGRPVTHVMPNLIPDTPENIARAVLTSPKVPPGGWRYLKKPKG